MHNRILILFALMALTLGTMAQNPEPPEADYPYRRDIEKGKYDKAAEKILRHLSRDAGSLECHYAAYKLFAQTAYNGLNYDRAYTHLVRAKNIWSQADPKYIERWARDSYSAALFDHNMRQLCHLALRRADSIRTPDAYQHFLQYFALAPDDLRDKAVDSRDTLEFRIATNAGTMEMIHAFICRRPSSLLLSDAVHLRDSMAFSQADKQHTTAAYDVFRTAYPHSEFYSRATDSVYTLDYRDVRRHDAEQYYRSYADRYPQSPHAKHCKWLADSIEYHRDIDTARWTTYINYLDQRNRPAWHDTALHNLARFALKHQSIMAATAAARHLLPGSDDHLRIAHFLHQAYIGTSIKNYTKFYAQFPKLMSQEQRERDSIAFIQNEQYHFYISDVCIKKIAPSHEAYEMLQRLLYDDINHGRMDDALATAQKYSPYFGDDYEYQRLLATLTSPANNQPTSRPLAATINGAKTNETAPVVSADGKTLYFSANGRKDNVGKDDIFSAHQQGNGWSNATIEMDLSHTYGNESPMSVSPDGGTLVVYQSGKYLIAERTAEGWKHSPLPEVVENFPSKTYVKLAPNGRAILFSAMSLTDHEIDSSMNLFVSLLDNDGQWCQPFELGATINTPFWETNPVMHPDMRTLYFASEGHGSMGFSDIYMSTRLDDTWVNWSTPRNLGRAVNGTEEDREFCPTADGKKAYIVNRTNLLSDIYAADLPAVVRPQQVSILSGTVKNSQGQPVSTTIYYEDPATGNILGQCSTHPTKGTYSIALPQGSTYNVYVQDPDYFPTSQQIDLTLSATGEKITHNFRVTSIGQMLEEGTTAILNNVTFEVANPNFTQSSQAELKRLGHIIRQGGYMVEVACHLDGNPGDKDNLALTQLRANSIRDYLIELGCRPADISARGYGSDRPLTVSNKTSSETARPQSRRVEVTLSRPR